MTNTMTGSVEAVEEMGPKMSGTLEKINSEKGMGWIKDASGKTFVFAFLDCVEGVDTFNQLKDGMNITFNERIRNYKGELINRNRFGLGSAINVTSDEIETTTTVGNVIPKTETTVAKVLDGATESVEDMGPRITGVIQVMRLNETDKNLSSGYITPTTEGYEKNIFFGVPMCV